MSSNLITIMATEYLLYAEANSHILFTSYVSCTNIRNSCIIISVLQMKLSNLFKITLLASDYAGIQYLFHLTPKFNFFHFNTWLTFWLLAGILFNEGVNIGNKLGRKLNDMPLSQLSSLFFSQLYLILIDFTYICTVILGTFRLPVHNSLC